MADVKWIKIVTDIFDDEKILLIESLPSADAVIVIWFKLLCLAGKNNNNGVFMLNNKIAYTDEMLATIFRRDLNTVRLALKTFENFGMVEMINNTITIPNWDKHQTLDAYEKKKERDRIYQAERREKQKSLTIGEKSSDTSFEKSSDVTKNRSLDKEEEREEDKEKDNIYIPYSEIIDYLNQKANTKYRATGKKTKDLIKARFNEKFNLEDFKTVIDKKCVEWLGTNFENYLRPETLFSNKFEGYLNQKGANNGQYTNNNRETKKYNVEIKQYDPSEYQSTGDDPI